MKELFDRIFERNRLNRRLHWTTIASEKILSPLLGYWRSSPVANTFGGCFR